MLRPARAALVLLASLMAVPAWSAEPAPGQDQQKVTAPAPKDVAELKDRFARADKLVKQHDDGAKLAGDKADVVLLQKLVDRGVAAKLGEDGFADLGVAFGEVLLREKPGLHWVVVEDSYGRELGLQYEKTSIILFPLSMLAKRLDGGGKPNLAELLAAVTKDVERLRKEAQ